MCVIDIPKHINKCINMLNKAGYDAYIVGGCVRDSIIGRIPNDWDICTLATPLEIKDIFAEYKTIDIGIEHGTIAVMFKEDKIEITTYRVDGKYVDNRRPSSVTFTRSLLEDLSRRDFTINAMAYNKKSGIIDYFGGKDDILKKVIRCVGDPVKRFNEDALRIMRALRFAAQLDYYIEDRTFKGIDTTKKLLKNISKERIVVELNKLILSQNPSSIIKILFNLNIFEYIINFIGECSLKVDKLSEVTEKCGLVLERCPQDLVVRLSVLINYIIQSYGFIEGCEENKNKKRACIGEKILRELKYDNKTIKAVSVLLLYYDIEIIENKVYIKKVLKDIDIELFKKLLHIKNAELNKNNTNNLMILNYIVDNNECFKINDLKINGKDIINLGIKNGKIIGEILNALLNMVIENPNMNDEDKLKDATLKIVNCLK